MQLLKISFMFMSVQTLDQWNLFSGDCWQKSKVLGTWQRPLAQNISARGDLAPRGHLAMVRDILGEGFFGFFFLASPCGLQALSSLTRDWTWPLGLKAQSSNHWVARKAPGNAAAISRGAAQMLPNTLQCTVPQQGATGPTRKDAECGAVVKSQRFTHITDPRWKHPNLCRCHGFKV